MSIPSLDAENIQVPEQTNGSLVMITDKPTDKNGLMDEYAKDDVVDEKDPELTAEFPLNGFEEPQNEDKEMDMPSLELSDNEFNSTDSDSFAGKTQKNRTLEMKLSAIIEKACSSDFEVEDPSAAEPPVADPANPPGKDPVNLPGGDPANLPGEDPASSPGKDPASSPGKDPANRPDEDPANLPGKDTVNPPGEDPANLPGGDSVDPPGEDPANLLGGDPANAPCADPLAMDPPAAYPLVAEPLAADLPAVDPLPGDLFSVAPLATDMSALPPTNVTIALPNNQVLFTVEGITVSAGVVDSSMTQAISAQPDDSTKNVISTRKKKYMYKLKQKGGTVLSWSSPVPVVIKRPRINLTRIELGPMLDVDTKKKRAKRKAPPTNSSLVNGQQGRGRPPKKSLPSTIVDDTVDLTDGISAESTSNSSFGMQTRKRKLKFMPDGRLCVAKRHRSSSSSSISSGGDDPPPKESTDDDWEATGEDLKELHSPEDLYEVMLSQRKAATKSQTPKSPKFSTPKIAMSQSPKSRSSKLAKDAAVSANGAVVTAKGAAVSVKGDAVSAKGAAVSAKGAGDAKKAFVATKTTNNRTSLTSMPSGSAVNPAQLLSTLLGVTIRPSQLNMVSFKPKSIQKQHPSVQKTIVLAGEERKGVAASLRTSSFTKTVPSKPKPLMQKILPKSSLTSIFNKTVDAKPSPSAPSILSMGLNRDLVPPVDPPAPVEPPLEVPNFEDFTDSRTVRTKAGPKKFLQQKVMLELAENEKLNRLAVYDLAQRVFDRTPSWNLHLMPDTNTFCIAQVGRGRMGIPILRKSVELSDNFAAKIFVHQLHCKKFDGVYDTEAAINSLIAEIDSLSA